MSKKATAAVVRGLNRELDTVRCRRRGSMRIGFSTKREHDRYIRAAARAMEKADYNARLGREAMRQITRALGHYRHLAGRGWLTVENVGLLQRVSKALRGVS